jgi:hypothetical protein
LPRAAKLLYTSFCAFTAAGLASCVGLYSAIVRFTARSTPAQLYGNLVERYRTASPHELLHFHLFSVPIYLLVAGHLFLLSAFSAKVKTAAISAAIAFTAVHLLAPWLVYFGGGALAWLYPISGAGMLLAFALLLGVPLYEMWSGRPVIAAR